MSWYSRPRQRGEVGHSCADEGCTSRLIDGWLIKTPKRYLVDPALAGAALGLDPAAVPRDGDLLGRLINTFAVAQLRHELELTSRPPRLYHLRDKQGRHEIDLIGVRIARVLAN
jgi:predicted AAA+ superfamily ATPase